MVDTWQVNWTDPRGLEQAREFRTYLEAWTFVEENLSGKGEVILLTDRDLPSEPKFASESDEARKREGVRRRGRLRRQQQD